MKTGYPSIDKTHLQGIPEEKLHPEIYPLSIFATFMKVNGEHLDEIAVEVGEKTYTKKQLRESAIKFAGLLLKSGIKAGDKIAIVSPNSYAGIVAAFGANAIGVQIVMLKPLDEADIRPFYEELSTHHPKMVLFFNNSAAWMSAVRSYAPYIKIHLAAEPIDSYTRQYFGFESIVEKAEISLEETLAEIEKHNLSKENEPAFYLKTSGSSAKSKTLPFSNLAIFAALMYILNSSKTDTRDTHIKKALCQASYYHGYGWMSVFMNIIAGNTVSLVGATPEDIAKYYKAKPSIIYGSPLTLKQFMELTPEDADLSSITSFYCAGAVLHEKDYEEGIKYFRERNCQAEIHNNYGISEGMCIGTVNDHNAHVPGTSGKFYIGPEWLIVDKNDNEVKYGEVGELIVSSASLCQGYFGDEELTKQCFIERDGKTFFRTGDSVSLREDGYVNFIGRERRFFIAVGIFEKINCEIIEEAISALDGVYQTAVIVTPDESGCKAFITLKPDFTTTEKAIYRELSKTLKEYELPREIIFLDKIPMMNSGKVNYKLLETM